MRPQTQELRSRLGQARDLQEKVDLLAGAYAGESAYLLACGPSLNSAWSERAEAFLQDKLVIAVKQAYDRVPGIADFHLLNAWNYQPYQYAAPAPILAAARAPDDPETPGMNSDVLFSVPDPRNYGERLATTWHFDRWLLSKSHDRPWGAWRRLRVGFLSSCSPGCLAYRDAGMGSRRKKLTGDGALLRGSLHRGATLRMAL